MHPIDTAQPIQDRMVAAATAEPAMEALHRLVRIAQSDTGQSRLVANFLLAWWNPHSCGGFDLTDLWCVDRAIGHDMLAVLAFIQRYHLFADSLGLGEEFRGLVATWRPHLVKAGG